MEQSSRYYTNNPGDTVLWLYEPEDKGIRRFTFDQKTIYNLWTDYPYKLTSEQIEIFDRENPFWADYFSDRK